MPNGTPPLWQASAALRKVSVVQLSALGALPAGYSPRPSLRAFFFIGSVGVLGPLIWLPIQVGTPSLLSPSLPRYLTVPLPSPFSWIRGSTTSFIGPSSPDGEGGHEVAVAR